MKTVKADSQKRIRLPDAKPRQVFSYELRDGAIVLRALVELPDTPLVKARKVNGRWVGAESVKLDRQAVVDAIRADRDAR